MKSVRDISRVSLIGAALLVLLRLSIGWQFLYEGLWKIDTLDTPRPWSAEGYLKNAQGPLRDHFREMTGDPDDLNWLNPDKMAERWDAWAERFKAHYTDLSEDQLARLDILLNGLPSYAAELDELPPGVSVPAYDPKTPRPLSFNAERKRLIVDGERRLTPRELDRYRRMAPVIEDPKPEEQAENQLRVAYQRALTRVYDRQARLSYKEKLRATLAGDPEIAGVENEDQKGTIDEKWLGEIDKYKVKLKAYDEAVAQARQQFQFDHLETKAQELQTLRAQLVNPIKALEDELHDEAQRLLTPEQMAQGPVPQGESQVANVNKLTIVSLTGLGILLLLGLFSRLAAVMGAGMLLNFYMVWPPWPGVPEPPGTEHAFIVNKNMIEIIALLAIAALPTGQWFGVDRIVSALLARFKNK